MGARRWEMAHDWVKTGSGSGSACAGYQGQKAGEDNRDTPGRIDIHALLGVCPVIGLSKNKAKTVATAKASVG